MSHSDLCGRCHQQRRVHIDTVAGLLCPTARFQAPAPRAPEAREPEPAPAEGAQDTSMELIHRGVAAAARVLAGQGIDTRGKLDLPPEVVSEVGEILAGGYGASPASGSTERGCGDGCPGCPKCWAGDDTTESDRAAGAHKLTRDGGGNRTVPNAATPRGQTGHPGAEPGSGGTGGRATGAADRRVVGQPPGPAASVQEGEERCAECGHTSRDHYSAGCDAVQCACDGFVAARPSHRGGGGDE